MIYLVLESFESIFILDFVIFTSFSVSFLHQTHLLQDLFSARFDFKSSDVFLLQKWIDFMPIQQFGDETHPTNTF